MIIAVDFDGTIVPDIFFPHKMPDRFMPGAKETLTELHHRGHALVLWTLRDSDRWKVSRTLQIAVDFLNANSLGFMILPRHIGGYEPNTPKFPADIFIDDKIPGGFQGWDVIRQALIHDRISEIAPAVEGNSTFNPGLNSGNKRAQDLSDRRNDEMGRSGRAINEPICGPLITSREPNWNQPKPFSHTQSPVNFRCFDACTFNNQRPFQPQVNCAPMAGTYSCFGLENMTPLQIQGLGRNPDPADDDTTQLDSLVHANPDRHAGKDD